MLLDRSRWVHPDFRSCVGSEGGMIQGEGAFLPMDGGQILRLPNRANQARSPIIPGDPFIPEWLSDPLRNMDDLSALDHDRI